MANKHSAEYQDFKFKRTSKSRTYSHVVIKQKSAAQDRKDCENAARSSFRTNRSYYESILDGTSSFLQRPSWRTPEQQAFEIERMVKAAVEHMEGGEEWFVARALLNFDAKPKRQLAEDGDTYFIEICWASRIDLAQKEARRYNGIVIQATITR